MGGGMGPEPQSLGILGLGAWEVGVSIVLLGFRVGCLQGGWEFQVRSWALGFGV